MSLALVYCRVSTDDQADRGVSLEVQEADCRAWCTREGFEVELFVDAGKSGRTLDRPALQELLGRLPEADALVVWRVDRLSRDAVDRGLIVRELRRRGVRMVAVQQPEIGQDSPESDLVGNVLGAVAEFESALLGARVKAARDRITASGRPLGVPPFGYRLAEGGEGWEVVADEAETIHLVDELFLSGLGSTRIAQELNRQGVPAPRGGTWWSPAVRHLLTRTVYAGLLTWGATRKVRGERTRQPEQPVSVVPAVGVPPIRDAATWDRLQRVMASRGVDGRAGPVRYPFTPVLRCGVCGSGMGGRTWYTKRGVPVRTYRCAGSVMTGAHPGSYLREEVLIEEVDRFVQAVLAGEVLVSPVEDTDWDQLAAELADLDRRRQRLVTAYTSEALSLEELQEHTARLHIRRQVLEERLGTRPEPQPIPAEEAVGILAMPENRDALRAWVLQVIQVIRWDGQQLDIYLLPPGPSREPDYIGVPVSAAPVPGAAEVTFLRPTAIPRPYIRPRLAPADGHPGHAPDDPMVRRYWSALVGPGAVADLLRLTAAARRGRRLRRPLHLSSLLCEGLVHRDGEAILVPERVPRLDDGQQRRLHPSLRAEYRRHLGF